MDLPAAVPPGSLVQRTSSPFDLRNDARRLRCVDFPQPSVPSKVMKNPVWVLLLFVPLFRPKLLFQISEDLLILAFVDDAVPVENDAFFNDEA